MENKTSVFEPMWDVLEKFDGVEVDRSMKLGVKCIVKDVVTLHKFLNAYRSPAHVWVVQLEGIGPNMFIFRSYPHPRDKLSGQNLKTSINYKICSLKSELGC